MIGLLFRAAYSPIALLVGIFSVCCLCFACKKIKLRDFICIKCCLRATGTDVFDDFDLLVHVHEASFDSSKSGRKTRIRVTAGDQVVKTDKSNKGFFHEVLSILVEQGTMQLVVELIGESGGVMASLKLNIVKDILRSLDSSSLPTSRSYHMTQKERGVLNPSVTLTFGRSGADNDEESGLFQGSEDAETSLLLRRHLQTAEETAMASHGGQNAAGEKLGEIDVLMHACEGPVELFTGFGKAKKCFLTITGPPVSRRYSINLWKDESQVDAVREMEVMRVEGVQVDPGRNDVFVISYKNLTNVPKKCTCRAVDRPPKVWVESITLLVQKVHDANAEYKKKRRELTDQKSQSNSLKLGFTKAKTAGKLR